MSYPKKAKGWRNLTFDNQQFRWCFVTQAKNSLLKLQGSSSASQQAIFTLQGWRDLWLSIGETDALPNEPKIITAKFASQAVAFALQNGWKPEESGSAIHFEYKDGNFVSL
jgi:hypothetical protein